MQSVLPQVGCSKGTRALIYDAKQDMISIIAGINPACKVHILNPFDRRCDAWAMSKDITSPAIAQQVVCRILHSTDQSSSRRDPVAMAVNARLSQR